jgi:hypothetical protein
LFIFVEGERVEKYTGDYTARGKVVARFYLFPETKSAPRYVVRHQAGGDGFFCHIYNQSQLRSVDNVVERSAPEGEERLEAGTEEAERPAEAEGTRPVGPSVEELQKGRHEETLTQKELSRSQGYTGDLCVQCSNFTMKRNGPCLVCATCGHTTGCT